MRVRRAVAIVACLLGVACAHDYVTKGEPSAELRIVSDQSGIFSNQTFVTYGDAACTPGTRDAGLLAAFSWATSNEKIVQVPVDRRLWILGDFSKVTGVTPGTTMTTNSSCGELVSFIPELSKRYQLSQGTSLNACGISLIDRDTGKPPASFQHQARCEGK